MRFKKENVFLSYAQDHLMILILCLFLSMTREQRAAMFKYWLSAVEVGTIQWHFYMIAHGLIFTPHHDNVFLLSVSSSGSAMWLSSKPNPFNLAVFSFQTTEGHGGKTNLSGCDSGCDRITV